MSVKKQKQNREFKLKNLSLEEKSRLVGAFVWLIEHDRKQNLKRSEEIKDVPVSKLQCKVV